MKILIILLIKRHLSFCSDGTTDLYGGWDYFMPSANNYTQDEIQGGVMEKCGILPEQIEKYTHVSDDDSISINIENGQNKNNELEELIGYQSMEYKDSQRRSQNDPIEKGGYLRKSSKESDLYPKPANTSKKVTYNNIPQIISKEKEKHQKPKNMHKKLLHGNKTYNLIYADKTYEKWANTSKR